MNQQENPRHGLIARVNAQLAQNAAANEEAAKYYHALKSTGRLRQALLAEYRCAQGGCLLLVIFHTISGAAFYRPKYGANPAVSTRQRHIQASPFSGPEKESIEGAPGGRGQFGLEERENHWPARSGFMAGLESISIRCEHGSLVHKGNEIAYGKVGHPLREMLKWPHDTPGEA